MSIFNDFKTLLGGHFDEFTFLVTVYPVKDNIDKEHVIPDSYSLKRVPLTDMEKYFDIGRFFYYTNLDSVKDSARFTLIFKRSELLEIPSYGMNEFLGVVAYNTNLSVARLVTPNPINWLRMEGQPFTVN
mgnify:FL=1